MAAHYETILIMDKLIENLLSEMIVRAADHFNLDKQEAMALVAQSRVANELCTNCNVKNIAIEDICQTLFDEISKGE